MGRGVGSAAGLGHGPAQEAGQDLLLAVVGGAGRLGPLDVRLPANALGLEGHDGLPVEAEGVAVCLSEAVLRRHGGAVREPQVVRMPPLRFGGAVGGDGGLEPVHPGLGGQSAREGQDLPVDGDHGLDLAATHDVVQPALLGLGANDNEEASFQNGVDRPVGARPMDQALAGQGADDAPVDGVGGGAGLREPVPPEAVVFPAPGGKGRSLGVDRPGVLAPQRLLLEELELGGGASARLHGDPVEGLLRLSHSEGGEAVHEHGKVEHVDSRSVLPAVRMWHYTPVQHWDVVGPVRLSMNLHSEGETFALER